MKSTFYSLAIFLNLALGATAAAQITNYRANLTTLNADLGSTASGVANLKLDLTDPNMPSITVQMTVTGMEDLTQAGYPAGLAHVSHVHGQFTENDGVPPTQQISGPFFSGTGGTIKSSLRPNIGDDADSDGFLNFFEGLPKYGPVTLNLSSSQVPAAADGVSPLLNALQFLGDNGLTPADVFPNGTTYNLTKTYSFDLSDPLAARMYNNLTPLDAREIVVHGLTVPASISDPIDDAVRTLNLPPTLESAVLGVDVGNDMRFRTTAPIAAGEIVQVQVPEPAALALALVGLSCGLLKRRRSQSQR